RDEAAWQALWGAHTGRDPAAGGVMDRHAAPLVNFDRCLVVAFFRGAATNEDGELVRELAQTADGLRVRFSSDGFQSASISGPDRGVKTRPFGIWVLPATAGSIVIEEGT